MALGAEGSLLFSGAQRVKEVMLEKAFLVLGSQPGEASSLNKLANRLLWFGLICSFV